MTTIDATLDAIAARSGVDPRTVRLLALYKWGLADAYAPARGGRDTPVRAERTERWDTSADYEREDGWLALPA